MRRIIRFSNLTFFSFLLSILLIVSCEKTSTVSEDQTPPEIVFGPEASSITDSSVVIYWETNEPANATVKYRISGEEWNSSVDEEYRMNHSVLVTALEPRTDYQYYVESTDFFGNGPTSSSEHSFRTTHNAISFALLGWEFFESAEYDSAINYFLNSIEYDFNYAEGHTGLGWAYSYSDQMFDAVASFTDALQIEPSKKDALAGRSAGYMSLNDYDSSIDDAENLLDIDSLYVFSHDTSVNYLDIHLIASESYFQIGDYDNAQQHVNAVDPDNGLNSADSTSWVVDGVQYTDYIEALLALIQKLVGIFGG